MPRPMYIYVLTLGLLLTACSDPQCPRGMVQTGKICRRCEPGFTPSGGVCRLVEGDAETDNPDEVDDDDAEVDTGDAGMGPSDGSSGPVDAANLGPTQAPDGASDLCTASCGSGKCVGTGSSSSCECPSGYDGTGTAACKDIDECAGPNACLSSSFPCLNTPGAYTCRGQYADWPMPEAAGSAKYSPKYNVDPKRETVIDQVTGLVWQRDVAVGLMYGFFAAEYCSNLTFAGSDDWRLPSKIELETLLSISQPLVTIDATAFSTLPSSQTGEPSSAFWTTTPHKSAAGGTWIVEFITHVGPGRGFDGQAYARCVRDGKLTTTIPEKRYLVGGSTVQDVNTTLTWQRGNSSTALTSAEAKIYCQNTGGGFRVPSVKELLTLIDPARNSPAVDGSVFAMPANTILWSASPYLAYSDQAWQVSFEYGDLAHATVGSTAFVKCVK